MVELSQFPGILKLLTFCNYFCNHLKLLQKIWTFKCHFGRDADPGFSLWNNGIDLKDTAELAGINLNWVWGTLFFSLN